MIKIIAAAAVAASAFGGAALAQDAAAGEEVFAKRCRTCHMIQAPDGETIVKGGKTGPNQYGLINNHAAHDPDFSRYGDDLKAAGEKGLVWTQDLVVQYLADPRSFLQEYLGDKSAKSNMAFKLGDEEDAKNVAAYLAQFAHEGS